MSIDEKLARIRDQAALLNAKSDQLNCLFAHIQRRLQEAFDGGGIEYWFGLVFADGWQLGYTKYISSWLLCVQQSPEGCRSGGPIPLTKAPRRVRIDAALHLAAFWAGLLDYMASTEKDIDQAIALAHVTLKEIP